MIFLFKNKLPNLKSGVTIEILNNIKGFYIMSQNVIDQLRERGLVKQVVFEEDLKKLLDEGPQSFYIGFDPTTASLHVGHFM